MGKTTTVTREMIVDAAFAIVRAEGFAALSARNVSKKSGCSTQPIYWACKNMEELKREVCDIAAAYMGDIIRGYRKTGNPFLDLGLGYVHAAYREPVLFRAFYMDNIMNVRMNDILPDRALLDAVRCDSSGTGSSAEELNDAAAKGWMLAHGMASLVAAGMLVYDEEKVEYILNGL